MRRLLLAANWKMNPVPAGAFEPNSPYREHTDFDVVVFPTSLDIATCVHARLITGGQCGRAEASGAFTGDLSMPMLAKAGCMYVLCGHSDRRAFHQETDEEIAAQACAALEAKLHPIVCIGETLDERKAKKQMKVIEKQVKALPLESDITIAYEPVWAISRGDPNTPAATSADAQEMHAFIRSLLPKDKQESTRILYGGSMKPDNVEELLQQKDIDGGLVGGASLKPADWAAIIKVAKALVQAG